MGSESQVHEVGMRKGRHQMVHQKKKKKGHNPSTRKEVFPETQERHTPFQPPRILINACTTFHNSSSLCWSKSPQGINQMGQQWTDPTIYPHLATSPSNAVHPLPVLTAWAGVHSTYKVVFLIHSAFSNRTPCRGYLDSKSVG